MNKAVYIFTVLAFCIQLLGCTGDPNRGGVFFDEKKAIERQKVIKTNLAKEKDKAETLRFERQDLERKIATAKKRLADLMKEVANSPSEPSVAEVEQIRQLKKEIAQLEKDIEELAQEAKDVEGVHRQ